MTVEKGEETRFLHYLNNLSDIFDDAEEYSTMRDQLTLSNDRLV